jgi:hypothetical protein
MQDKPSNDPRPLTKEEAAELRYREFLDQSLVGFIGAAEGDPAAAAHGAMRRAENHEALTALRARARGAQSTAA